LAEKQMFASTRISMAIRKRRRTGWSAAGDKDHALSGRMYWRNGIPQ